MKRGGGFLEMSSRDCTGRVDLFKRKQFKGQDGWKDNLKEEREKREKGVCVLCRLR